MSEKPCGRLTAQPFWSTAIIENNQAIKTDIDQLKTNREELKGEIQGLRATSTATGTKAEMLQNRKETKSAIQEKVNASKIEQKNLKEAIKAKQEANKNLRSTRMTGQLDKALQQLTATITATENLAERTNSRIEKMQKAGVNVTAALAQLADTRTKITAAKTAIDAAKSVLATVTVPSTETTPEITKAFASSKTAIKSAQNTIRIAHQALVLTITTVAKSNNPNKSATSTVPTTQTASSTTN